MYIDGSIQKVVIFGDAGCGKTTLVQRFMTNAFIPANKMTIGVDFHYKTIKVNGFQTRLLIWDFAGEERFRFTFPNYIVGAKGGILMYDISDQSSFSHLINWLSILNGSKLSFPILLLGAKSDLDAMRTISKDQGREMAEKLNLSFFSECSSKTGENVEEAFQKLTELMINHL